GEEGGRARAAALPQHPGRGQAGADERGEEQQVVARDRVRHERPQQEELEGGAEQVVRERQGAPQRMEEVGVPKVGQAEADLVHPPLEEIEVEDRIPGARREMVGEDAPDRPQVEAREERIGQGGGEAEREATEGLHGVSDSECRGRGLGRVYLAERSFEARWVRYLFAPCARALPRERSAGCSPAASPSGSRSPF